MASIVPAHACWMGYSLVYIPIKIGGERGIRTLGTVLPVQRFSKPPLSATQASLRVILDQWLEAEIDHISRNPKTGRFGPFFLVFSGVILWLFSLPRIEVNEGSLR